MGVGERMRTKLSTNAGGGRCHASAGFLFFQRETALGRSTGRNPTAYLLGNTPGGRRIIVRKNNNRMSGLPVPFWMAARYFKRSEAVEYSPPAALQRIGRLCLQQGIDGFFQGLKCGTTPGRFYSLKTRVVDRSTISQIRSTHSRCSGFIKTERRQVTVSRSREI